MLDIEKSLIVDFIKPDYSPGGRTIAKAFKSLPLATLVAASTTQPAASRATFGVNSSFQAVSMSAP